jgi:hypothetical protein
MEASFQGVRMKMPNRRHLQLEPVQLLEALDLRNQTWKDEVVDVLFAVMERLVLRRDRPMELVLVELS